MRDFRFKCPECGDVKPTKVWYTCPTTAECPSCRRLLEDTDKRRGIHIIPAAEAAQIRSGYQEASK